MMTFVLNARRLSILSISVLLGLAPLPLMAQTNGAACQTITMPDNSRAAMRKDVNGQWQPCQQTAAGSNGFPARAEVTYRGTYRLTVEEAGQKNSGRQLAGQMDIRLTVNGASLSSYISGTGLTPISMTGTIRNGSCHLVTNDSRFSIVYEGTCNLQRFVGETHGSSSDGGEQAGAFDTSAVQVVDLDERDRQAAVAQAAAQQQAAAAQATAQQQAARQAAFLASRPKASSAQTAAPRRAYAQHDPAKRESYDLLANHPPASIAQIKLMETALETDTRARGYEYNRGSLHDVVLGDQSNGITVAGLYYTSDTESSYALVVIKGGVVTCIQYGESGACRPVRHGVFNPSGCINAAQIYSPRTVEVYNPHKHYGTGGYNYEMERAYSPGIKNICGADIRVSVTCPKSSYEFVLNAGGESEVAAGCSTRASKAH